jgi:hypothetical protein
MANIYKKLGELRHEVLRSGLKKSGKNPFAKFEYFELADFIPTTLAIEHKLGLFSKFDVENNNATLTIYDTETGESAKFTVPFQKSSNITDDAQAVGAGITYTRRYLYVNMLELTENDSLDATAGNKHHAHSQPQHQSQPQPLPQPQTMNFAPNSGRRVVAANPAPVQPSNSEDNRPAVGTKKVIDGVEMIVLARKDGSDIRFWAATDRSMKKTIHIGAKGDYSPEEVE